MNHRAVLAAFDEQLRRGQRVEEPGARVERVGEVVRHVAAMRDGWSAVVWSGLDGASADAAIAEQVRDFGALGWKFEWRHYDYDRPADLPRRLLAAGFVAEPADALMVAEVANLAPSAAPPPGIRLLPISDEAGVALVVRVHEAVFGTDHAWLHRALLAQLAQTPPTGAAVVAMAGDLPVCSARVDLGAGKDFASLFGGGTLPSFRGRGIYQALLAHRVRIAAERGFRYLHVGASAESQPILERAGFARLATMTPYVWRPQG